MNEWGTKQHQQRKIQRQLNVEQQLLTFLEKQTKDDIISKEHREQLNKLQNIVQNATNNQQSNIRDNAISLYAILSNDESEITIIKKLCSLVNNNNEPTPTPTLEEFVSSFHDSNASVVSPTYLTVLQNILRISSGVDCVEKKRLEDVYESCSQQGINDLEIIKQLGKCFFPKPIKLQNSTASSTPETSLPPATSTLNNALEASVDTGSRVEGSMELPPNNNNNVTNNGGSSSIDVDWDEFQRMMNSLTPHVVTNNVEEEGGINLGGDCNSMDVDSSTGSISGDGGGNIVLNSTAARDKDVDTGISLLLDNKTTTNKVNTSKIEVEDSTPKMIVQQQPSCTNNNNNPRKISPPTVEVGKEGCKSVDGSVQEKGDRHESNTGSTNTSSTALSTHNTSPPTDLPITPKDLFKLDTANTSILESIQSGYKINTTPQPLQLKQSQDRESQGRAAFKATGRCTIKNTWLEGGMVNQGNECYIITALNALLSIEGFPQALYDAFYILHRRENRPILSRFDESDLTPILQAFLKIAVSTRVLSPDCALSISTAGVRVGVGQFIEQSVIQHQQIVLATSVKGLKDLMAKKYYQYGDYIQHDVPEFLNHLLDEMAEEIAYAVQEANKAEEKIDPDILTLIDRYAQIVTRETLCCDKCGVPRYVWYSFGNVF